MFKKKRKLSTILWVGGFVAVGVLAYFLLRQYSRDNSFVFWVGAIGSYASIFGLIVMFVQFKSVRGTTEETKNKLDGISLITEWSKATELIRSAETDIERDDMSIAIFKLRRVKDIVIQSKKGDEDKECDKAIKMLNSDISMLNQFLLSIPQNRQVDKMDMLDGLELISDILSRKINNRIEGI